MTATIPHPYLDGMAEEWIAKHAEWYLKNYSLDWAITTSHDGKLVGCMSLSMNKFGNKAEIGYWIGEEFWGNGYCTEAAKAAINFSFKEKNLHKITGRHVAFNLASGQIMKKNGMKQEGYFRQELFKDGVFNDSVVYGILRSEWAAD